MDPARVLLRTEWSSPLESGGHLAMSVTYLLHDDGDALRITAYLNHRDLPLRSSATPSPHEDDPPEPAKGGPRGS